MSAEFYNLLYMLGGAVIAIGGVALGWIISDHQTVQAHHLINREKGK